MFDEYLVFCLNPHRRSLDSKLWNVTFKVKHKSEAKKKRC